MTASRTAITWRWLALAAIVGNIVFNYLSTALGLHGDTVGSVAQSYPSLFAPAPWAFSIWGLIYAAFLAWGVAGVLPRNYTVGLFDRIAPPLTLVNVLASLWIAVFEERLMVVSVAIIVLMLALACLMFVEAHRSPLTRWVTVPFALFLGWISVATIANVTILLVAQGWRGGPIGEPTLAAIMTSVAGLLGVVIAVRFRDFVVPAVIAWAATALYLANLGRSELAADIALGAAIVNAATAASVALSRITFGDRGSATRASGTRPGSVH